MGVTVISCSRRPHAGRGAPAGMRDGFDLVGDRRVLAGGCAGVLVMALMQMAGWIAQAFGALAGFERSASLAATKQASADESPGSGTGGLRDCRLGYACRVDPGAGRSGCATSARHPTSSLNPLPRTHRICAPLRSLARPDRMHFGQRRASSRLTLRSRPRHPVQIRRTLQLLG
jgi:hypothetical protein